MEIQTLRRQLQFHPLYPQLARPEALKLFMSWHIFAVWDFMSLLKSLQRRLTCVEVPWRPSLHHPELARLINEIVLGEESDLSHDGRPLSHFALYLEAMREVGVDTAPIHDFLGDLDLARLPAPLARFVEFNLRLAQEGSDLQVASVFFHGREKLVPGMFQGILEAIAHQEDRHPALVHYFRRHIEVDGESHGPMALKAMDILAETDPNGVEGAHALAVQALKLRLSLWDALVAEFSALEVPAETAGAPAYP